MPAPLNPKIQDLVARLNRDPDSKIFLQLAEEYRRAGHLEEALLVCKGGLKKHPGYHSARVALGRIFLSLSRLEEARIEFEAVTRASPENLLANRMLGDVLALSGDAAGARERYRSVIMYGPADNEIRAKLEALERGEDPQRVGSWGNEPAGAPRSQAASSGPGASRPAAPAVPTPASAPRPATPAFPQVPGTPAAAQRTVAAPPAPAAHRPMAPAPAAAGVRAPAVAQPAALRRVLPPDPETPPAAPVRPVTASAAATLAMRPLQAAAAPPAREAAATAAPPRTALSGPAAMKSSAPVREAAAPVPPAAPTAAAAGGIRPPRDSMSTQTLAELYARQGFVDRAIEVYRRIQNQEPGNAAVRRRLAELVQLAPAAAPSPAVPSTSAPAAPVPVSAAREARPGRQDGDPAAVVQRLQGWLRAIQAGRP